eukprot:3713011-Rhodomonas_salina.4
MPQKLESADNVAKEEYYEEAATEPPELISLEFPYSPLQGSKNRENVTDLKTVSGWNAKETQLATDAVTPLAPHLQPQDAEFELSSPRSVDDEETDSRMQSPLSPASDDSLAESSRPSPPERLELSNGDVDAVEAKAPPQPSAASVAVRPVLAPTPRLLSETAPAKLTASLTLADRGKALQPWERSLGGSKQVQQQQFTPRSHKLQAFISR